MGMGTGTGLVWLREGAREDAGGRTPDGGEGEELTELTFADDRRGAIERVATIPIAGGDEDEAVRSFPANFGPYGVGNESSMGWNSGPSPRNSGQILGLIPMPLQTPEFGFEFCNSKFLA
jgi:hypothetical protein